MEHVTDSLSYSPYQALQPLSREATPAQLDSAMQTWLRPVGTLNGQPTDKILYTEYSDVSHGIAGDPVPYTLRGDNAITALLLFCFIAFVLSLAKLWPFISRQLKNIVYPSYNESTINETGTELRLQFYLLLQMCLLLSLVVFQYVDFYMDSSFALEIDAMLVLILFAVFVGFYLLKIILYLLVNSTFFDVGMNLQWNKMALFIYSLQSILFFPVALLIIYFNFSLKSELYYIGFVLFFAKTLIFYKSWDIFFRQNGLLLQTFLYFCALEIVPFLSLISGLVVLVDNLKLNI